MHADAGVWTGNVGGRDVDREGRWEDPGGFRVLNDPTGLRHGRETLREERKCDDDGRNAQTFVNFTDTSVLVSVKFKVDESFRLSPLERRTGTGDGRHNPAEHPVGCRRMGCDHHVCCQSLGTLPRCR